MSWALTGIVCKHCEKLIFGQQTLGSTIRRAALVRGAKEAGAVQHGEDWFCSRSCRTAHELSPGVPKNTISAMPDLDEHN